MVKSIATTFDFDISAIAKFLPEQSNPKLPLYLFSYLISIKNNSNQSAKLINRFWEITDSNGRIKKIKGQGIIGKQPLIEPGQSIKYESFCPLTTEFGFMEGYYEMTSNENIFFKITIPRFFLSIPNAAN